MGRIYFHTPERTAEVSGPERAYTGLLCTDLATALAKAAVGDRFVGAIEGLDRPNWELIRASISFGGRGARDLLAADGTRHPSFETVLNTVLAVGNEPVRLLARIHGQCEIHGYIEWSNLAWFADVIEQGLALGVMRAQMGWESVIDLARTARSPIVMSYSVCDQFPNAYATTWEPTEGQSREDWYELGTDYKWIHGWEHLRAHPGMLEIAPGEYHFGEGTTLLSLGWQHAGVGA